MYMCVGCIYIFVFIYLILLNMNNFQIDLFDPRWDPNRYYHSRLEWIC